MKVDGSDEVQDNWEDSGDNLDDIDEKAGQRVRCKMTPSSGIATRKQTKPL